MEIYLCKSSTFCEHNKNGHCGLIPGACELQKPVPAKKPIQECCLCAHRKVCKYRKEFEEKKDSTYIKLECKYFMN